MSLLPRLRVSEGVLQAVLPLWLYDLAVLLFFPLNWLISHLARQAVPETAPAAKGEQAGLKAIIRRRDDSAHGDAELWALFAALPPPAVDDMLGNWRGKVVLSGGGLDLAARLLENPLRGLGLEWGKRYFSALRGDPFILVLWDMLVLPIPVWGNVSLAEVSLLGTSGATMVYDHQPWMDHFRLLDDGKASGRRMLLGNWLARGKNGGWFTLEASPELDEGVADLMEHR